MNQLSECFYDEPDDSWREVLDGHFEAVPEDSKPTSGLSRAVALLLIGCFATPIVLPLFPSPQPSAGAPTELAVASEINLGQVCSTIAAQVKALQQLQAETKDGTVRPRQFQERYDQIGSTLDQSMDQIGQWQFPSDQQRQARELMLVVSLAGEARGQLLQAVEAESPESKSAKMGSAKSWLRSATDQIEETRQTLSKG